MNPVVDYIVEEVRRQGHDINEPDGWVRVAWMLEAWCCAFDRQHRNPTVDDAIGLGKLVERHKNALGIRTQDVFIGWKAMTPPENLNVQLVTLFERVDEHTPMEFYRAFETIHPFIDGNGRTGKILLNWLNHSLRNPIFPPNNFWGKEIENP